MFFLSQNFLQKFSTLSSPAGSLLVGEVNYPKKRLHFPLKVPIVIQKNWSNIVNPEFFQKKSEIRTFWKPLNLLTYLSMFQLILVGYKYVYCYSFIY